MRFLALLLFLVSSLASAGPGSTAAVTKSTPINAVDADDDYNGAWLNASDAHSASFHCKWASLTGVLDGHFDVQVSNDGGLTAVAKSGATITVSGATGSNSISINVAVTELLYRVIWVDEGVTGGSVTCNAALKG